MPQTGMDMWVIAGVVFTAIATFIAWRTWLGRGAKRTKNVIIDGNRNVQEGGEGQTENTIERGNDNRQSGA